MQLNPVTTVGSIEPGAFKKNFYRPGVPVIIKDMSKDWPAYTKWNWDYWYEMKKKRIFENAEKAMSIT